MPPKATKFARKKAEKAPAHHDWRTTDADEINKRRQRAREEKFKIQNLDPQHPVFSNFSVHSASGLCYSVEIRDLMRRQFSCNCVDFRINRLGTCKHVEAVLLLLQSRFKPLYKAAKLAGPTRIEIVPDVLTGTLRAVPGEKALPRALRTCFNADGSAVTGTTAEVAFETVTKLAADLPELRVSQDVPPWMENRRRGIEATELRHQYELKVQSGEWPVQETFVPLFPYQREGMLHLAFTERALLADEMGLGKTIQAIAACALLHRLGKARRVLVVTPASLKTEWEEQIRRFTGLPYRLVFGNRLQRLATYTASGAGQDYNTGGSAAFFTIVNYEQMVSDSLDVNERLRPDIVVLDEAQRIKNWSTKTAQAVKRLQSRYAFVLTGTPIENRIDELHSLMDFLNPGVLGPLFCFNREFYELDDRGRPVGFRNLDRLHARIAPYMLRRRKAQVETELPMRTDRNHLVPLSVEQRSTYSAHEQEVMWLVNIALKRPLTQQQSEKLQRELAMMRMICDTNYILDPKDRVCPKLAELEKLLEECRENDAKIIVFSEWERMLDLVRTLCQEMGIGFAWHTGSVPQQRRRAEINAFKEDPACRVFLSTDSGATGLNLQVASVVVNCDLPWNPAKLEQRIARAWRKHQTKPVTVINLVSENTIEHRMLATLAAKQTVSASVLDTPGEITAIKFRGIQKEFLAKLKQMVTATDQVLPEKSVPPVSPIDPAVAFVRRARERLGPALVGCEERFPQSGPHSVLLVIVERDAARWRETAEALHNELFGAGKTDPLAPTKLEVIDRATHDAIEALTSAGLLVSATRATRPLFPVEETAGKPATLSADELAKLEQHRERAVRALGIARVLAEAKFEDEARPRLLEAILHMARGLAVRNRMPEPEYVESAIQAPLSHSWGKALAPIRQYIAGSSHSSDEVRVTIEALVGIDLTA